MVFIYLQASQVEEAQQARDYRSPVGRVNDCVYDKGFHSVSASLIRPTQFYSTATRTGYYFNETLIRLTSN